MPGNLSLCDIYITNNETDGSMGMDVQSGGVVGPASALAQVLGGKIGALAGLTGTQAADAVATVSGANSDNSGTVNSTTGAEINSYGVAEGTDPAYGMDGQAMKLAAAKEGAKKAAAPAPA